MFRLKKLYTPTVLIPLFVLVFLVINYIFIEFTNAKLQIHNGCNSSYAKFIRDKTSGDYKLSFCDKWNQNKTTLVSDPIPEGKYINFDYIGFPNDDNITIYLEDDKGKRFIVKHLRNSSEGWRTSFLEIPKYLNSPLRLIAEDYSTSKYGWIGIGSIHTTSHFETFKISVYLRTIFLITMLSLIISIIFGSFLRQHNPLKAYIYMSFFIGLSSFLTFNVYLINIKLGYVISMVFVGLIVKMFIEIWKYVENYKDIGFIFMFIFSMISTIFFIAYSDVGDLSHVARISADKWHHLPVDNWIPKIFADAILRGDIPTPLVGDWLASDRPPLQTGLFLIFGNFLHSDLLYLVVSVGAQLLVIVFIFLLLKEYIKDKKYLFVASILLFFNGFVFVNGLFVWPKLFSSLYQGIAFYYLYTIWQSDKNVKYDYIGFGVAAVLAFLTHGGSIFYLLSLSTLLLVTLKNKERIKYLLYGLLSAIILYIPWLIYQKVINPPGDRLLKWHIANQHRVTDDSFLTALIDYYSHMSFHEWIELRVSHLNRIFHTLYGDVGHLFDLTNNRLLDNVFFSVDYSYMFFSSFFLLLVWFVRYPTREQRKFTRLLITSFVLYIVFWVLILTSGTVIHQGAHFGWFSGFIAVSLVIYFLNQTLFYLLALLNVGLFVKIYILGYCFKEDMVSSSIFLLMVILFLLNLYDYVFTRKIK